MNIYLVLENNNTNCSYFVLVLRNWLYEPFGNCRVDSTKARALVDVNLPSELKCSICKLFFKEAVMIPCCPHSFCEKCKCISMSFVFYLHNFSHFSAELFKFYFTHAKNACLQLLTELLSHLCDLFWVWFQAFIKCFLKRKVVQSVSLPNIMYKISCQMFLVY